MSTTTKDTATSKSTTAGKSTTASKTTATKKKTKSPGRPKGATTADRAEIEVRFDPCPHCQCTRQPVNKRLQREGAASGTHSGRPYGYYRFHTANCSGCGRAILLKEYDYLPETAEDG